MFITWIVIRKALQFWTHLPISSELVSFNYRIRGFGESHFVIDRCLSCVGTKGPTSHFPVSAYFTTASAAPDQISWSDLYHLKNGIAQSYTIWPVFPLLAPCGCDPFVVTQLSHLITFIDKKINIVRWNMFATTLSSVI